MRGGGGVLPACSQDTQKVSADQAALTQAQQQLATAQSAAKTGDDQAQAKVGSDKIKLQGDQANLASDRATAVNPGTTYTWLPVAGAIISQDQPVYSVSGEPVPLLYGLGRRLPGVLCGHVRRRRRGRADPRPDRPGLRRRPDPERPLLGGHRGGGGRWQKARGLPATGEILLGEVVFEPGPIRVTSVTPSVGASVGGGGGGRAAGAAAAGRRRERADGHQHHPGRHRRPGGDPGVPGQAGRRGHGGAARRHLDGGRARGDGRQRGRLPGRRRHRHRRQRQLGRPVAVLVRTAAAAAATPPRR